MNGLSRRLDGGTVVTRSGRPLPKDLDARVWPTRPARFHSYQGLPIANLLAGRGCYAHCRFCSIDAWTRASGGFRFRQRNIAALAEEIAWLYHARGVRLFNFHDDNFFHPRKADNLARFGELRQRLDAEGVGRIGLQIKARPDSIDAEVVEALLALAAFRVFLGVESNSVHGLEALGRGIRREQNHLALELLEQARLHVAFNLLVFEPDCTVAHVRENLEFMRAHASVPLNFCRTEVYGGTPLERDLAAQGRLRGTYLGYDYRIADATAQRAWELTEAVFTPRNFTLEGAHHLAMAVDYEWKVLQHFRPRAASVRLTRRAKDFVRDVNLDSAARLEQVLELAEAGEPGGEVTARLSAELVRADQAFTSRASALLDALRTAAQKRPLTLNARRVAAGAAAAAMLLGQACDQLVSTQPSEMVPAPHAMPVACNPMVRARVETAVHRELDGRLSDLVLKHHVAAKQIEVLVKVSPLQRIESVTVTAPALDRHFEGELSALLAGTPVDGIRSLDCPLTLIPGVMGEPAPQLRPVPPPRPDLPPRLEPEREPDTHMAEMAPRPTHMHEMAPRPLSPMPPPTPRKKDGGA